MEFIEKHKALIITTMLMSIVVLSMYNISMFNKQKEQSEILMEIPEEFLAEEEPEPEEALIAQEDRQLDPSSRTHAAYNEDFEDHDEIEQRIKSLTEAEQTEQAPEEEAPAESDESIPIVEEKKPAPEEETNNRNSSLTYNLNSQLRTRIGKFFLCIIHSLNHSNSVFKHRKESEFFMVIFLLFHRRFRFITRNL